MSGVKRGLLESEKELVAKYWDLLESKKESIASIAIKEGVTHKVINRIFKLSGYIPRNSKGGEKYTIDKDYFENINTEHKAYWLGFLWADGCTASGAITMELQARDKDHLDKLLDQIFSGNKPELKEKDGCVIAYISGKKLVSDLSKLGFGLKDNRRNVPNISEELLPHFIRGYFDGDGDFESKSQVFRIAGRTIFLENLIEVLPVNCSNCRLEINKNEKSSRIIFKSASRENIINYLYKNATIFLERKRNLMATYISDDIQKTS